MHVNTATKNRHAGFRGRAASLCVAWLLVSGCDGGGRASSAEAAVRPAATPSRIQPLPLQRGFYVASDLACEQASNATLGLLHAQGMNGSRTDCVFETVEAIGTNRYRIVEHCAGVGSSEDFRVQSVWEILTPGSFRRRDDSGWQSEMRYCEQSMLPQEWREIDLEAAIAR